MWRMGAGGEFCGTGRAREDGARYLGDLGNEANEAKRGCWKTWFLASATDESIQQYCEMR